MDRVDGLPRPERGRPPKYPWDEWMRPGEFISLQQGVDFSDDVKVTSFRALIYRTARERNGKASVQIDGTRIVFIFTENE